MYSICSLQFGFTELSLLQSEDVKTLKHNSTDQQIDHSKTGKSKTNHSIKKTVTYSQLSKRLPKSHSPNLVSVYYIHEKVRDLLLKKRALSTHNGASCFSTTYR